MAIHDSLGFLMFYLREHGDSDIGHNYSCYLVYLFAWAQVGVSKLALLHSYFRTRPWEYYCNLAQMSFVTFFFNVGLAKITNHRKPSGAGRGEPILKVASLVYTI